MSLALGVTGNSADYNGEMKGSTGCLSFFPCTKSARRGVLVLAEVV
jgi:hypothetical protein